MYFLFSYQQLREFSELTARQNKKNIPQWVYNAGEEISSVQVIQVRRAKHIKYDTTGTVQVPTYS